MMSKSRLEYDSYGAAISNVRILDEKNRVVNILEHRARYKLVYDVSAVSSVTSLRHAMAIKTISGLELGGMFSHPDNGSMVNLETGTTTTVEFNFVCIFNAGVYFINTAIHGVIEKESIILHRIIDALCFKVLPAEGGVVSGIVDFSTQE